MRSISAWPQCWCKDAAKKALKPSDKKKKVATWISSTLKTWTFKRYKYRYEYLKINTSLQAPRCDPDVPSFRANHSLCPHLHFGLYADSIVVANRLVSYHSLTCQAWLSTRSRLHCTKVTGHGFADPKMGSVLGKVTEETPKFELVKKYEIDDLPTGAYGPPELRKYEARLVAEYAEAPSHLPPAHARTHAKARGGAKDTKRRMEPWMEPWMDGRSAAQSRAAMLAGGRCTFDPHAETSSDAFRSLARYIGVFGR